MTESADLASSRPRRRRWWLPIAVPTVVLVLGLSNQVAEATPPSRHCTELVVASLIVGLVLALTDRRLHRFGRSAIGAALAVGVLFGVAQLRVPADPLTGEWYITYGAPARVMITATPGGYTMTATSPTRVHNSQTCDLPPGTVIATFAGTAPTLTGRHGLWAETGCQFAGWDATTFTIGDQTVDVPWPTASGSSSTVPLDVVRRVVGWAASRRSGLDAAWR